MTAGKLLTCTMVLGSQLVPKAVSNKLVLCTMKRDLETLGESVCVCEKGKLTHDHYLQ